MQNFFCNLIKAQRDDLSRSFSNDRERSTGEGIEHEGKDRDGEEEEEEGGDTEGIVERSVARASGIIERRRDADHATRDVTRRVSCCLGAVAFRTPRSIPPDSGPSCFRVPGRLWILARYSASENSYRARPAKFPRHPARDVQRRQRALSSPRSAAESRVVSSAKGISGGKNDTCLKIEGGINFFKSHATTRRVVP